MSKIRVLIADDQSIIRSGLKSLLFDFDDIELVAEASNGAEAVSLTEIHEPDLVLMDLKMPVMNGLDATRKIHASNPHIAILVLTGIEDESSVFPAMRAGARGYLLKDADAGELSRAIHTVASGGVIFSASIAHRVLEYLADASQDLPQGAFDELTNRERQILELLAHGLSNGEIAERLSISAKTVSNTVSNVIVKLHVVDRAKLIILALEAGFGKKNPLEPGI